MEKIVKAWNQHYRQLGKETRLKDLDPASYESLVARELLGLCGEDPKQALAVFRHPDNEGGWMLGSVDSALEKLVQETEGV
jgi:hypothetical protein